MIETGLPDFNKIVVTTMKTTFRKMKSKIINEKTYKHFSSDTFRDTLSEEL